MTEHRRDRDEDDDFCDECGALDNPSVHGIVETAVESFFNASDESAKGGPLPITHLIVAATCVASEILAGLYSEITSKNPEAAPDPELFRIEAASMIQRYLKNAMDYDDMLLGLEAELSDEKTIQ